MSFASTSQLPAEDSDSTNQYPTVVSEIRSHGEFTLEKPLSSTFRRFIFPYVKFCLLARQDLKSSRVPDQNAMRLLESVYGFRFIE
jgi:hypothetical protein